MFRYADESAIDTQQTGLDIWKLSQSGVWENVSLVVLVNAVETDFSAQYDVHFSDSGKYKMSFKVIDEW